MDWLNVAQTVGVPLALLGAIVLGLWKALVWSGANLVKPLMERHIDFLDQTVKSMDRIAQNQERCAELQSVVSTSLEQLRQRLDIGER